MTLKEFCIENKKISMSNYVRILGGDCYFYKTKKALVNDYLQDHLLDSQLWFFDFDNKDKDKVKDMKEWKRKIMSFVDYDKVFKSLLNAFQLKDIDSQDFEEFEFDNFCINF